jgi:thioredoxin reductase
MVSAEESGEKVQPIMTKSLIVATGATAKRLYLPGEETSVTLYVLDGYFNAFC